MRGTITVVANVDASLLPGRVELALAGRVAEARDLPAPATSGLQQLAFVVNTAARDQATGQPLYPNGVQLLTLSVTSRRRPAVAGCPEDLGTQTVPLQLTLVNPTAAARGP